LPTPQTFRNRGIVADGACRLKVSIVDAVPMVPEAWRSRNRRRLWCPGPANRIRRPVFGRDSFDPRGRQPGKEYRAADRPVLGDVTGAKIGHRKPRPWACNRGFSDELLNGHSFLLVFGFTLTSRQGNPFTAAPRRNSQATNISRQEVPLWNEKRSTITNSRNRQNFQSKILKRAILTNW
jgi:hypothetical protein